MAIMEIENSRRILAVALTQSSDHLSRIVKDLTGSHPTPADSTLAGTTHPITLKTPYYTATVPVWLDLITTPSEWATTFLSPEAKEVLNVLGGIIVVFPITGMGVDENAVRDLIREMGRVICDGLGGRSWDGVTFGIGVGSRTGSDGELERWDDLCTDAGLEFVHVDGTTSSTSMRNEFGEKTGIPRVREALETNNWAQGFGGLGTDDVDDFTEGIGGPPVSTLDDPESLHLGLTGDDDDALRVAILESSKNSNPDDTTDDRDDKDGNRDDVTEGDVEKIELMMQKLLAAREAGQGMDEQQRRRMAARAVAEVMREL